MTITSNWVAQSQCPLGSETNYDNEGYATTTTKTFVCFVGWFHKEGWQGRVNCDIQTDFQSFVSIDIVQTALNGAFPVGGLLPTFITSIHTDSPACCDVGEAACCREDVLGWIMACILLHVVWCVVLWKLQSYILLQEERAERHAAIIVADAAAAAATATANSSEIEIELLGNTNTSTVTTIFH